MLNWSCQFFGESYFSWYHAVQVLWEVSVLIIVTMNWSSSLYFSSSSNSMKYHVWRSLRPTRTQIEISSLPSVQLQRNRMKKLWIPVEGGSSLLKISTFCEFWAKEVSARLVTSLRILDLCPCFASDAWQASVRQCEAVQRELSVIQCPLTSCWIRAVKGPSWSVFFLLPDASEARGFGKQKVKIALPARRCNGAVLLIPNLARTSSISLNNSSKVMLDNLRLPLRPALSMYRRPPA